MYIKVDISKADILAGEMLASLTVRVPGGKKQWCWIPDGRPQDWKSRVAYRRQDYDDRVTGRSLGDTG